MYVLRSDITIGSFRFGGVHEVRIWRSVHSYVERASIQVPGVCRLIDEHGKPAPDTVITGKQFHDGDPVSIKLGYNGDLREEFRGFVKIRDLNMPLEIECEGYSYQLRRNNVSGSWKSTTVSEVLKAAIHGTDVKLRIAYDTDLINVLLPDVTGADVIDFVIKATGGAITCFFIAPDTLYAGLPYTPNGDGITGLGADTEVKYRLGWNVIKDNSLKERIPNADVEVRIKNKKSKRAKGSIAPAEAGRIRRLLLQWIESADALAKFKDVLELKANYTGYQGKVSTFLVPFAAPGYKAFLTDSRYKERDGVYFIESVETIYGMRGARRAVEIGPKLQA